jgi:hypothetical protein
MGSSSGSKSSQARLREALTAGNPTAAKGPPVADGVLSVTPDTAEAIEWKSRKSVVDTIASCSTFLDDDDEGAPACCRCPPKLHLADADQLVCSGIDSCAGHLRRALVFIACTLQSALPARFRCRRGDIRLANDCHAVAACLGVRAGPPTCELYGKFTWQLDKFGESGKRELRSNVFEVGSFKWCAAALRCALHAI